MNSLLRLAWLLTAIPLIAQPVLHIDTATFEPNTTFRLTFDQPVVESSVVGTTVSNNLLAIDPPLTGTIRWTAPDSGEFIPGEAPAIGAEYSFSITGGETYRDGTPLAPVELGKLRSAPFGYEYGSWRRVNGRTPHYLLRFNDETDPEAAASHLSFVDREGARVSATARRAIYGDLNRRSALGPTWSQRFAGWQAPAAEDLTKDTPIPSAILVTPVRPLPVGENWKLVVAAGLPNAAKSATTGRAIERWIGTIRPFEVTSIQAVTLPDTPRYLSIGLSKALPPDFAPEELAKHLRIEPEVANANVEINKSRINIQGDFPARSEWKVTVTPGLRASDGLALKKSKEDTVRFRHLTPRLTTPSFADAQLALGSRTYAIQTTNLASVRVRVKHLTGESALRAYQGYRHYSGDGPDRERIAKRHPLPWSLVAGEPVYDKTLKLDNAHDTSRAIELNWDEILGSEGARGLLFLSLEGTPKDGMEDSYRGKKVTQVFLQLTDIGLAWKSTDETALLYAYSCDTGRPLPGVSLAVFGEDATALQSATTNDDGTAILPRDPEQRHLRASLGDDALIVPFDASLPTVSMWRFPVSTSGSPVLPSRRTAFLFTDRTLYRPGEEVHLKGLVRRIENNRVSLDDSGAAELVIRDSSRRIYQEQAVALSAQGSFDHSFQLPPETVGMFSIELRWPEEITQAEATNDWRERSAILRNARFTHTFNVQEFRRNAFEITSEFRTDELPDRLQLDLTARYFQEQPVSQGEVDWFYRSVSTGFYPDQFRDYLFCDHRTYDPHYWSYYFGYREYGHRGTNASKNGGATLNEEGMVTIDLPLEDIDFPSPRIISMTTEVRDQRNQTLAHETETTVHSSELYVGLSRVDKLLRIGEENQLKAVVVDTEGQPAPEAVEVALQIEREIHEQIKTRSESGTVAVRNEVRLETIEKRSLTIRPEDTRDGGLVIPFQPQDSGKYILTISGHDPNGAEFRTAVIHRVYGSNSYPWAYENGMLIKLVPEKKRYKPGETARILVQSPIEGTALVTIEREGVHRHFIHELKADEPVVEIPVTDEDAPNTFVSVLVIKGSQDNLRKHKEPILRLGYCELTVETVKERLQVSLQPSASSHRPGETVTIRGEVRDSSGQPVSDAEITLFAEDEGTLAVAGYDNPDPLAHFYAPRQLRTKAGTSLELVLSEDPAQRHAYNKGFFVGGGGDEMAGINENRLRKDFNPCAIWAPSLRTHPDGTFSIDFNAPDTLTRYRVIAVAHHGASRFGSQTSDFAVKKPLMLEPAVPRFAHEGDRLQPKVLIQNATAFAGTWRVSLEVGSLTRFSEGSEPVQSKTITLPPDGSATLPFDLTCIGSGTIDWRWRAQPLRLEGAELTPELATRLSDAVQTTFPVEYPMPLLRETHFVRFEDPAADRNLLDGFSPDLLDGRGELHLEFGKSLLLEAGEALNYLLKYPYGCLEQTTSSTLPWIAAAQMRDVVPAFRGKTEEEIQASIQAGANRLLSMQCSDGGLAYWPGGRESTDWATAYGGLALILCREAGASVPESALTALRQYLSGQLRGVATSDDWWQLETACRACYTLALAGDPQVPYHNKLIEQADRLSPNALSFLALAVSVSGADNASETASDLLTRRGTVAQRDGHFLHRHPSEAYRLLALVTISPQSSECAETIDHLIRQRGRLGHWGTTWNNAWVLFALGEYARKVESQSAPPVISYSIDDEAREIRLDEQRPSEQIDLPLHGGLAVTAAAPSGTFARLQLAAKPKIASQQSVSKNGLQILRRYHLVKRDGSTRPLEEPEVGDLVKVELQVTMPRDGTRYIVIDDPLPSLFEPVNTEFASQAGRLAQQNRWRISNQELRDDRALFFVNHVPRSGIYTVSYHARVTTAGEAMAPPAKVEAMYEPEFYALSNSKTFRTPNPLHSAAR